MKHPRATAWGAGVMGVAGLLGTVLGPSPLLLPFAPLISVAYVPFAVATSALGMPAGLVNLGIGGKAAFIVWCILAWNKTLTVTAHPVVRLVIRCPG